MTNINKRSTQARMKESTSKATDPGYYGDIIFAILDDLSNAEIYSFLGEFSRWRALEGETISDLYKNINRYLDSNSGYTLYSDLCNCFGVTEINGSSVLRESLWTCFFDDKEIGTVEAATEHEAKEKMMDKYPEYPYGMYDGCFWVEPDDDNTVAEEFKLFEDMWDVGTSTYTVLANLGYSREQTPKLSLDSAIESTTMTLLEYDGNVSITWLDEQTGKEVLNYDARLYHLETAIAKAKNELTKVVNGIINKQLERQGRSVGAGKPAYFKTFGNKKYNLTKPYELEQWFEANRALQMKRHPDRYSNKNDSRSWHLLTKAIASNLLKKLKADGVTDPDILKYLETRAESGTKLSSTYEPSSALTKYLELFSQEELTVLEPELEKFKQKIHEIESARAAKW